jgi:hypothetical protein
MKKYNLLSLVFIGLTFVSFLSCQKSNVKSDIDSAKIMRQLNEVMSGNFDKETARQNFQILIDSLNNEVLPSVSGKDKDETKIIIQYFESLKNNANDHLSNEDNLIEAGRMLIRLSELFLRTYPNDFDTNLIAATGYIQLATSIGGYDDASEKAKSLNRELNKKGLQAAKALVQNFPKNPISYYQLAHSTFYTGGDEKEVKRQLEKCLEIDKTFKDCKDFLKMIKEK